MPVVSVPGETLLMTAIMYLVAPMMMGLRMDIAAMLGSLAGGSWAAGIVLHFVNGTIIYLAISAYAFPCSAALTLPANTLLVLTRG